jgi:hypothetical protein
VFTRFLKFVICAPSKSFHEDLQLKLDYAYTIDSLGFTKKQDPITILTKNKNRICFF